MATGIVKYNALAIDPETETRLRLKQATVAVNFFHEVLLLSTVHEALFKLNHGTVNFDIVFISERLSPGEVETLIRDAKASPRGQDAAFVSLVHASENNDVKAAENVLAGFDTCLVEPYSVDALVEITNLANEVKKLRREERQRQAIKVLVDDIMRYVDRLAYIQQCHVNVGPVLQKLKKACKAFGKFDEAMLAQYYEVAAEVFESTQPYGTIPGHKAYAGVSDRIKRRMIERILAEEGAYASSSSDDKV